MEKNTKQTKNIDNAIYELPEIGKRPKSILWAWICVPIGAGGFFLSRTFPEAGAGMSSLFTGMLVIGVFGLLTIVLYYLVGDCCTPYCRPARKLLERESFFYAENERDELMKTFENKDIDAMDKVKRSAAPDYTLVRYSDKDEKIFYMQILKNEDGKNVPVSEIVKVER